MATSGTATTNFDIGEILEEAYERCGLEIQTGYDLKTGRRSLNLLSMEWGNRGILLWTLEQGTPITLVAGTKTYTLPADTIDIFDVVFRKNTGTVDQSDITLNRITTTTYSQIPSKEQQGQPIQYVVERKIAPSVTFWEVPDGPNAQTIIYWRIRRIQDAGTSIDNTMDVPPRFIPAFISGLSYYISIKKAPDKSQMLQQIYAADLELALREDRDRASSFLLPMMS